MTPIRRQISLVGSTLLVMVLVLFIIASQSQREGRVGPQLHPKAWNGWASVEKIFVLYGAQYKPQSDRILTYISGDSWSDAWFNLTGPQPGPHSPFGNSKPSYPDETAVYGAYWFMYLTTQYNQSFIETYCFARSADTVNASITPHGSDFVHEVRADFLPLYGGSGWHSASSLFAMFFGVNDSHMVSEEWEDDIPMLLDNIFATYNSLVEQLYQNGARNFLFINLPPMDRAPSGEESKKPVVQQWNMRLQKLANNVSNTYKEISVFHFDLHHLFEQVINDPTSFPQTAHIKNTTDNCDAYGYAMRMDLFDPSCGIPLNQYLWENSLHPTYPMHQAMAAQIAKALGGEESVETVISSTVAQPTSHAVSEVAREPYVFLA